MGVSFGRETQIWTVGIVLLLAYLLSFGPAYWVSAGHPAARQAFGAAYQPLAKVASRNATVAELASWYLRWGMRKPPMVMFADSHILEIY